MKKEKAELRKQMARLKAAYTAGELEAMSAGVIATLEAHPAFANARVVLLYHSLKDEVDTRRLIDKWSTGKQIILPVVPGEELELRIYTGPKDLRIGAYGIAEPTGSLFTDYASIELVVVPGVAFDSAGHRLGRGKGYYDRLLPRIPAMKAGICFPFQLVENVPSEPTDIGMDTVISLLSHWQ